MRKIVIAPDSFKESLSAREVATIIARGLASQLPHTELLRLPVADGGEGTLDALLDATVGQRIRQRVTGPQDTPLFSNWGLLGDGRGAVIEMASASGLEHVPRDERNPLHSTSYGTGELIRSALDHGARHIILALGGSATNDGGAGMLAALGVRWLDACGQPLPPGGGALAQLAHIDSSALDPRLAECRFDIACDVDNPLCGPHGASAIFGPQKGADAAMVAQLDQALAHYGRQLERHTGHAIATVPGAGAAGGMGAAALAFFPCQLRRGIDIVLDSVGLDAALEGADLVITGEGRLDGQTVFGKTPIGVARRAKRHGLPVIAIGGSLGDGVEAVHQHGIDAVFACVQQITTLDDALEHAATNLERCARNVGALLALRAAPRR